MNDVSAQFFLGRALIEADLFRVFNVLARQHGTVDALAAPGRTALRYAAIPAALTEIKSALNSRGIGRGDVVVIAAANGADAALLCVAVSAFAISVPLNPGYSSEEYRRYLGRIRPSAVIVLADQPTEMRAAAVMLGIDVLELVVDPARPIGAFSLSGGRAAPCRDVAWNAEDDVAMLGHTSGTTAQQKLIPIRTRHLLSAAVDMHRSFRLVSTDRTLHVMPLFHGHGMRAALLQPLLAGSTVVCVPGFSAADFLAQLRDHAITWYTASFTIHKAVLDLLRDDPGAARGIHLRFIRSGSGRLSPEVMLGLEAALGTVVIERYGQTETGTAAVNPLPPGIRKPGSVGLPEGCEIVIRSLRDFSPLPRGEEGEVTIRGPGVFDGYLDDPEATQAAFRDGWFRSGDMGRFDDDGHLTLTGRLKELINRGGEKVSPMEVEAALARHPGIRDVCAFALPHPRLGEDVAAAVVAMEGAAVDEDDLIAFAAETLADFKIPRRIFLVRSLALGATHKVDRRAVARQCLATEPAANAEESGALDPRVAEIRRRLEPLWCSVLKLASIPAGRDFFLLGGDSLSAALLATLVAREFGITLLLRAIFREARTLTRMAATIALAETADATSDPSMRASAMPIARRDADARIPLSFAQEQIWLHDQLQAGSTAYTIYRVARLRGPLDPAALEQALTILVARHEVLRTTIRMSDGAPHQLVHPPTSVQVPVTDLMGVADELRAAELEHVVTAELRQAFDLAVGPLLRVRLWRLGREDHVFLLALHHILVDGGSIRALSRELADAYRHLVSGAAALPPPSALQFGDFAIADRRGDERGALAPQLAYWRRELEGVRELDLPTDRPRQRVTTADGMRLIRPLSRIDGPRLRLLARSDGSSLFGVLIVAVQVLLHRLTGATDIVLGAPFSRRARSDLEAVVGLLINVLPIRADMSDDPSFRKVLRQVTGWILGAIEHQDAPLTRILDTTGVRRSPDRHPLFQTVVVHNTRDALSIELADLKTEMIAADDGSTKFDLLFSFVEHGDELELRLQYGTALFDGATVERLADNLERLLVSITATPDARLSTLEIIPEAQRVLQLQHWSGIGRTPPVLGSIAGLFCEHARARPSALAVVCGERRVSYATLDDWSTRLAHRLRAAGVGPESVIGLGAGRTPALLAAQLAILKLGAAFLPLDAGLPASRLEFMVRDAAALLVLAEDAAMPVLAGLEARVLRLDPTGADLADAPTTPIESGAGPNSLAYVMYTSGSTGTPKGVAVEQRGVIRLVRDNDFADFGPDQRFLQLGSVAFDVSIFETWGALLNGGCVVQIAEERPSLQEIGRVIVAERVTTAWFTAGLFHQIVDHVLACCAGVGQVIAGGEVLSVSHVKRFRAAHPACRLINGYGPTEATTFATTYTVGDDAALNPSVPIGRPIANTQAYVLDETQRLLPIGAIGELCLGGAGIARGYVNRPELTAQRFIASPFAADQILYRTGDLVRWRSNGELQFLGRADRQVKLRGFRIEPVEIETALQTHEAVDQAVALIDRDATGEPRLVAFCVLNARAAAPGEPALRGFLRERLPHYMVPSAIAFLPALPLTPQGKVDLRALPKLTADRTQATRHVAPRTPFEAELAGIWRDVLGVRRVGITDDFFELGGHSLLAVKMLFRVWDAFAVELKLSAVFEAPTIEALALLILERLVAAEGAATSLS